MYLGVINHLHINYIKALTELCIQPDSACEFLTCGEDGAVFHADLRDDKAHKLFSCRAEHKRVPLYTIFTNPRNIYEFAVGGRDQFARVYDRRKLPEDNKADVEPIKKYCPHHLMEGSDVYANITCLVYSYNGTELLVSYNDENIYLFDSYSRWVFCCEESVLCIVLDYVFLLHQVIRDNDRDREEDRQRPHDPISEHLLWLMMNHIRRRQSRNENGDPDSDDSELTDDDDDDNDDEDGEFGNRVQCSPS
ncbi:PREDICTED: DDB1- and CUL4-associated factor 8-like [Acropora digitifera]|uniref:DDB1- and CUL4-associated factor 8-like n=1 Tax=Acropora digitifera TaxID=70779 RepID=UPI00077A2092|nr:PREDICTED: DDB1- and CUL4-associated factor 8-like [Acropora digitifera]